MAVSFDAYRRLAVAVMLHALHDAEGTGETATNARQWLTTPSQNMTHWCACAGLTPEVVIQRMTHSLPLVASTSSNFRRASSASG